MDNAEGFLMVKNFIVQVIKSALASLLFSLVFVLVFTLIIQLARLSVGVIKPVNQVFKIISVAVGCLIFIKGERGLFKGAASGLLSTVAAYLLFSAIGDSFSFGWTTVTEFLLGAVAGAISGLISARCRQN